MVFLKKQLLANVSNSSQLITAKLPKGHNYYCKEKEFSRQIFTSFITGLEVAMADNNTTKINIVTIVKPW